MRAFQYVEPKNIEEVLRELDPENPFSRVIAGGTGLALMMKTGVFQPEKLISLTRLEGAGRLIVDSGADVTVGAMVSLSELEDSAFARARIPGLGRLLARLSNRRVRNQATVGGALCHGDPHMDLPPTMIALDATARIVSPSGGRNLPVADLYSGYYETTLAPNEVLADISIPMPVARHFAYLKFTTRSHDDWPSVGVAASFTRDGNVMADVRVVLGAAVVTPRRLSDVEAILEGATISKHVFEEAGACARKALGVDTDSLGSEAYKRSLIDVLTRRVLRDAADAGAENGDAKK
jgi:carbon-monoxide dehydrogenase medium subunit